MNPKNSSTRRPARWVLSLVPVLVFLVVAKKLNTNPPTNSVQTASDSDDETLRSRFYQASWPTVVEAAQGVLRAQRTYGRAWKIGQNSIAGVSPQSHLLETLRAQVPVLVFTDDLEVTLREEDENTVRVDVRSKSRIGRGDFGENRRHVLQFLRALDEVLAR